MFPKLVYLFLFILPADRMYGALPDDSDDSSEELEVFHCPTQKPLKVPLNDVFNIDEREQEKHVNLDNISCRQTSSEFVTKQITSNILQIPTTIKGIKSHSNYNYSNKIDEFVDIVDLTKRNSSEYKYGARPKTGYARHETETIISPLPLPHMAEQDLASRYMNLVTSNPWNTAVPTAVSRSGELP